jgi:hypothetical protein
MKIHYIIFFAILVAGAFFILLAILSSWNKRSFKKKDIKFKDNGNIEQIERKMFSNFNLWKNVSIVFTGVNYLLIALSVYCSTAVAYIASSPESNICTQDIVLFSILSIILSFLQISLNLSNKATGFRKAFIKMKKAFYKYFVDKGNNVVQINNLIETNNECEEEISKHLL